eukprot:1623396-Amphidinium_carterae.2
MALELGGHVCTHRHLTSSNITLIKTAIVSTLAYWHKTRNGGQVSQVFETASTLRIHGTFAGLWEIAGKVADSIAALN